MTRTPPRNQTSLWDDEELLRGGLFDDHDDCDAVDDNLDPQIAEQLADGDYGKALDEPQESSEDDVDDEYVDNEAFAFTPTDLTSVEVRRSARRKRTVTAYRENGRTIVVAPARMSQRDIDAYVRELVGRLDSREQRASSGTALYARAQRLVAEYFERDVLAEREVVIRWVTNQNGRWGSCTPGQGHIRLSHRLMDMPDYVIDCVLLHELAHLIVSGHGPRFRSLIAGHPDLARADAYLAGYALAAQKAVNQ